METLNYNKKCWEQSCPKVDCKSKCCCGLKYVNIPSSLGDDSEGSPVAPENGMYCNSIVVYEANRHVYFYSSEGVPTLIDVDAQSIAGVEQALNDEVRIRANADAEMRDALDTKLDNFSNSNTVAVGQNLLTNSSLWVTNSGWNGTASTGFEHIVGQSGDLEYNYSFAADKIYIVDFQITTSLPSGVDNASNDWTVIIGNTYPIITYRGGGSMHYTIALKPTQAGSLKFKCVKHNDPYTTSGAFEGTISNITLKEASGNLTQLAINDANGDKSIPFSVLLNQNKTIAIGNDAGISNFSQAHNVYIGESSGKADTTGYFNTGIGSQTLRAVVNASRNTAIGYSALANMESGDRNTGIGTFAMSGNKYGRKNIAIGFDTMMTLQTGEDNTAIGNQALISVTNVKNQMAIGPMAMGGSTYNGDSPNIAIGKVSLYYNTTGVDNIGIGWNSSYKNTTGYNNIAIGTAALSQAQTGYDNIAIGKSAMGTANVSGHNNLAMGSTTLAVNTSGNGNIGVGKGSLYKNTTGNNNVAVGANALAYSATISGLIGIGANAGNRITGGGYSVIIGSDMNQADLATADRSVAVGSVNLQDMTSLTNSCILGYNIKASSSHTALQNVIAINTGRRSMEIGRDNYINIANTIYADTYTIGQEKVGIGVSAPYAWLHLPASTTDGGTAPLKFTAGTLMTSPEDGAFEYDGTHLYFTIGGVRNTLV